MTSQMFHEPHPDELPILADLRRLETDDERADWLLRLPLFFFVTRWKELRDALDEAGFAAGIAYLEAERMALHRKRLPDGAAHVNALMAVHLARIDLKVAARRNQVLFISPPCVHFSAPDPARKGDDE